MITCIEDYKIVNRYRVTHNERDCKADLKLLIHDDSAFNYGCLMAYLIIQSNKYTVVSEVLSSVGYPVQTIEFNEIRYLTLVQCWSIPEVYSEP